MSKGTTPERIRRHYRQTHPSKVKTLLSALLGAARWPLHYDRTRHVLVLTLIAVLILGGVKVNRILNEAGRTLRSVRKNQESGEYQRKLLSLEDAAIEAVKAVKSSAVGLTGDTFELRGLIADMRRQAPPLTRQVTANLQSVQALTDEGAGQLRQLGDSATADLRALLPLEEKLGLTEDDLRLAIQAARDETGRTYRELRPGLVRFMEDLPRIGGNVDRVTDELAALTGNLELASERAPEIAALWEKMMRTSSRLQKLVIVARILGLLGPLFGQL